MAGISEIMETAVKYHRAGNFQQAEQRYLSILHGDPDNPVVLHSLGLMAHQQGRHDAALNLVTKAVAAGPQVPQFHNTLGVVFEALGDLEQAVGAYQHAVSLKPDYAEAYNNMAIALQAQAEYADAVEKCKKAILLRPDYAEAYNTMAFALQMQGRYAEAAVNYREAVRFKPDFAEAYNHLGVVLSEQALYDEAVESYKRALQVEPGYAEVYNNLGIALKAQGRFVEAVASYEQALRLEPDFPEACYNLANAQRDRGQFEDAIANCERAIHLKPDYAEAYNVLGICLNEKGQSAEAVENYERALQLEPHEAEFYNNLGIALKTQVKFDEAIANYEQALRLEPDFPEAYYNLAGVLRDQGQCEKAIEDYRHAIRLKPDYAEAHWNLALALLLNGDYAEGWKGYRWRRDADLKIITDFHSSGKPRWDGSSFVGKTLFVHHEQGLGDNIQFVRYLPMLKARGGTVIFETLKPLIGLFRTLPGIDELVEFSPTKRSFVNFDVYTSLLDMPEIFATTLETIPADVPYIHAAPAKAECWQNRLSGPDFKVGIVWAGSRTHGNDHNRSCPLARFMPLAQIPGVRLYGLQKGEAARQATELSDTMVITDLAEQFEDFTDTAAAIENLDLVISVDTAVLHLAGAMAKPVWALQPFAPEWRWMLHREDSPWYPTMRLFRQRKWGDWDDVFKRVAEQLKILLSRQASEAHKFKGQSAIRTTGINETMETAAKHHQPGNFQQTEQPHQLIFRSDPDNPVALHSLGVTAHRQGRHDAALDLLTKAITTSPQVPQFHNTLGVVFEALGKLERAVGAYKQAVSLKPDYAEAYNNMAIALQAQGKYADAVEKCKKAILLRPDYAEAYNTMAFALQMQGQYAEAAVNYREAVRFKPDFAEAYNHLGVVLSEQGLYGEAIESYKRALQVEPDYAEVYNNRGIALKAQGQFVEAVASYEQALRLEPDFPEACYNLANAQKDQEEFEEVIANCERAIRLKPDYAEAYNVLGICLNEKGQSAEAVESYRRALQLKPDEAEFYNNLGIVLRSQLKFDEAIANYEQAMRLEPDFPEAYYNLAGVLRDQGQCEKAIENYRHAIRLKPDDDKACWNLSHVLLLSGRFAEGWEEYDWWRCDLEFFAYPDYRGVSPWDGSPFVGKRLLVHYERGFGDNLHFVRYLPMVKARGGTVIFEAAKSMLGLLCGFPGIDELVEASPDHEPGVEFDLYTPLLALPKIFATTLETIPAEVPYIRADSEKARYWQKRLSGPDFKVGIVWAGLRTHGNDHNRSCPLARFMPLAQIPGVQLYGLQKDEAARQVAELSDKVIITNLAEQFEDFTDTAAAIENLDLVISVDTAVLHLAGAMGKPVWALLPFAPEWRWMLNRQDSPWYPTMRLFRQRKWGDWEDVFQRVAEQLQILIGRQGSEGHKFKGQSAIRTTGVSETIETAVEHHRAGNFQQAEQLYQLVLQSDPDNPVVLHSLGLMAHQQGRHDAALDLLTKPITSSPR